MAEDTEKPKELENAPKEQVSSKKKMLFAVGIAIAVLGTGVPLGYFLMKPSEVSEEDSSSEISMPEPEQSTSSSHNDSRDSESVLMEGEEALGAIVPLDTFLVNLSGGKYLRLQLQIEMETPDIPKRLYSRIVPIRDGIITMLTQKTAADLEEVTGKDALKKAIKDSINEQLRRQDVRRVYFTQFVIQ